MTSPSYSSPGVAAAKKKLRKLKTYYYNNHPRLHKPRKPCSKKKNKVSILPNLSKLGFDTNVKFLLENCNFICFVPKTEDFNENERLLDILKHESLLMDLGLWDFVHVEFDKSVRADLVAQLIRSFDGTKRCAYVNGLTVGVSQTDLARALKLQVGVNLNLEWEGKLSEEFITFLEDFVSSWVLLGEDASVMSTEVRGYLSLIKEGHPEKVDWASLFWHLVEGELKQGVELRACRYASHLHCLIKSQRKEELLGKEPMELKQQTERVQVAAVVEDVKKSKEMKVKAGSRQGADLKGDLLEVSGTRTTQLPSNLQGQQFPEQSSMPLFGWNTYPDPHMFMGGPNSYPHPPTYSHPLMFMGGPNIYTYPPMIMGDPNIYPDPRTIMDGPHPHMFMGDPKIYPDPRTIMGGPHPHMFMGDPSNFGNDHKKVTDHAHDRSSNTYPHPPMIMGGSNIYPDPRTIMGGPPPHMFMGDQSNFGNSHKRVIDSEQRDTLNLDRSSKRTRAAVDNLPDFGFCIDQVGQWLERGNIAYMEKERSLQELSEQNQVLQGKLHRIEETNKSSLETQNEELQKKEKLISSLEREINMMVELLVGYKEALKEKDKDFSEYRHRAELPVEPLHKDAGPGGLVLSVTEIERMRQKQEKEDMQNCLMIEEIFNGKFEALFQKVQTLDSDGLTPLENEVKLLKELYAAKRKASETAGRVPSGES